MRVDERANHNGIVTIGGLFARRGVQAGTVSALSITPDADGNRAERRAAARMKKKIARQQR